LFFDILGNASTNEGVGGHGLTPLV